MTQAAEKGSGAHPPPVRLSRSFPAPRKTVFNAWSSAEHVKHWFAPSGYTVPHATVQMHVGGPFEVCMRAPAGVEHWVRGTFAEVSPDDHLLLDLQVEDARGHPLFRAQTDVNFAETADGTRIDVVQTYTMLDPSAASMVTGAPAGWAQTLDKLAVEIERLQGRDEARRSAVHATFHLQRSYDAPIERVFRAFSDEVAKSKWFGGADGQWQSLDRRLDFRVGGRERLQGRWAGGVVSTFDAIYHDIIPPERIIYTYEMHQGDRKISVSLATVQLQPAGAGRTTLMVTEQGAFLDGCDDAGSRERGTSVLLDRLGAALQS